ncbi:hypothetical protein AB0I98_38575 [Streptomyces sp. NPDC050211]|uniref:hypothetical protein n=1 Tax=Streptomyces sp. NPDC050211 TaxID=3154932 RepID=UPI00343A311F
MVQEPLPGSLDGWVLPEGELRSVSAHKTGVEAPFLAAYRSGPLKMNYPFADYQRPAS